MESILAPLVMLAAMILVIAGVTIGVVMDITITPMVMVAVIGTILVGITLIIIGIMSDSADI